MFDLFVYLNTITGSNCSKIMTAQLNSCVQWKKYCKTQKIHQNFISFSHEQFTLLSPGLQFLQFPNILLYLDHYDHVIIILIFIIYNSLHSLTYLWWHKLFNIRGVTQLVDDITMATTTRAASTTASRGTRLYRSSIKTCNYNNKRLFYIPCYYT